MRIRVFIDSIDEFTCNQIINYYNNNKLDNEESLENLDRCEGGFKIKITNKLDELCDSNEKIKQLRWNKKCLIPYKNYESFSNNQSILLFESM